MINTTIQMLIFAISGAVLGRFAAMAYQRFSGRANAAKQNLTMAGIIAGLGLFAIYSNNRPIEGQPLASIQSAQQLQQVIAESENPIVLKFEADWCGACRAFEPTVRKSRDKWSGKVDFYSIDVDQAAQLAREYNVQALPTLIILKNDQEYTRTIGVQKGEYLDNLLKAVNDDEIKKQASSSIDESLRQKIQNAM